MTARELKALVSNGETDRVEFKRKVAFPEKIAREVIAFANSGGGNLLIGISDDKQILGIKYPEEESYELNKTLRAVCRPAVQFTMEVIPVTEKKFVLNYYIPDSRRKPHYLIEGSGRDSRKSYIRLHDKSVQASEEMQKILRNSRSRHGVTIKYTENEKRLLKYLEDHQNITLDRFSEEAAVSRKEASGILVNLVSAKILRIIPGENEDLFVANL